MTVTAILPAFLACAIFNGDTSSLTPEDEKWLEAAYAYAGKGHFVDCSDQTFFCHRCDLPGFNLGAECLEYTILYKVTE